MHKMEARPFQRMQAGVFAGVEKDSTLYSGDVY